MKTISLLLLLLLINLGCSTTTTPKESFEHIDLPVKAPAAEPNLTVDQNQNLYISWQEKGKDGGHQLQWSRFENNIWKEANTISSGGNWFANWADFPSIVSDGKGNLIAHWLQKSGADTYAYDVMLSQSNDNGKTWSDGFKVHGDTSQTEHGFVSILPHKDLFFITWLDGRNTGASDHGSGEHLGAMSLRSAYVDFSNQIIKEIELDHKVCDCCQTGAALTSNGPVVVYRDRTDAEIRDIYIVREINGEWTRPKVVHQDNWEIKGCPVNGPKAAAHENLLAVAWYTGAKDTVTVQLAISTDAGENFSTVITVDDGDPIGRVDVAVMLDESIVVSWLEGIDTHAEIRIKRYSKSGALLYSKTIAESEPGRTSGFPQMEVVNQDVFFAWTTTDSLPSIKTAKLSF